MELQKLKRNGRYVKKLTLRSIGLRPALPARDVEGLTDGREEAKAA